MGLNVFHIRECCFLHTLIYSPYGNHETEWNYFMENARVRFLFTKSEVVEDERINTENE